MITTIRQLRTSTKEILSAVNSGQRIVITKRGRPCAEIVPLLRKKTEKNQGQIFGMWKDHRQVRSVKKYIKTLRASRHAY